MKKNLVKYLLSAGFIIAFSGICFNGLSQAGGGKVKLSYNYPVGQSISYLNKSTMAQVMDIEGQSMQTDVTAEFGCTIKATGQQDNNLKLEIIVDTLGQLTNSPMGGGGGAIMSVKGKSCNIIISPQGKPLDISEAANVVYNVEGSGESNLSQSMSDLFPVLPSDPVSVGDVWNMSDSILTKSSTMTMKVTDNTVNKLEGFETVDGKECAKISTQHSGMWNMSIQSQGMDIEIKGPYTGTSECLFAVKEGYFIKNTGSSKMTGKLDIISMGMSMPIVIDSKSVNEMRK